MQGGGRIFFLFCGDLLGGGGGESEINNPRNKVGVQFDVVS